MDSDEYRNELLQVYLVARFLRQAKLGELNERIEHAHALGPILDPTLYRDKMELMRQDGDVVGILLDAQRKLNKLPWPSTPEATVEP